MRAKALAVILIWIASTPWARGDELTPDWLSSAPPRKPVWNLFQEEPPSRPGEDFTDILQRSTSNPSYSPQGYLLSGRYQKTHESRIEYVQLQSKLDLPDLRDYRDLPYLARNWTTTQSLNFPLPVAESLFLFGNVDSTGDAYINQQLKMKGKTGFGWKWLPFNGGELQLRTGPVVSYTDVYNPIRPTERSQLSVELQAKVALFGPLFLQYSGEALPAFAQADRHTLLQDLKIALPFGTNREFHVGAKYRWEDTLSPSPWVDRAQLYLGLQFQH